MPKARKCTGTGKLVLKNDPKTKISVKILVRADQFYRNFGPLLD